MGSSGSKKEMMADEKVALDENNGFHMQTNNTEESSSTESVEERETWGHKIEFVLTCVGYCVGLGNVWRFPYLTYKNGGGAFLIPYFVMLMLCGMPLFLMELAIGQYFHLGPVSTWNAICPIAKGIGFSMMVVAFLCTVYYNIIISWVLYYMYASLTSEVPWAKCSHEWNTKMCREGRMPILPLCSDVVNKTMEIAGNLTSAINATALGCVHKQVKWNTPSEEYWTNSVLQITDSLDKAGSVRPGLVVALILGWALVFLCLFKGIKSSGKVVYFTATFPYVVMFILLIRGATLEGAGRGISFYLKPDFAKLANAEVWVEAATQIFYSLGIGFGSLIAFGSYNKFENNVVRDAVCLSLVNCFTSVFAGLTIFAVLGHMSVISGVPVDQVVTSGPGLVFVVYPEGLSKMPVTPVWAVLFFFMILTIGLDTQFAMLEAVIVGFVDEHPWLHKKKMWFTLFLCSMALLFGLPMTTQGGMYVLNLFNWQSGGVSLLFLAFFEVMAISYGYGADRFEKDLEMILKKKPLMWWKLCWKYFSPLIILVVFFSSLVQWKGMSYGSYKYPVFGEVIGWLMACSSMIWIPVIAIKKIRETPGTIMERIRFLSSPNMAALRKVEIDQGLPPRTISDGVKV